MRPVIALVIVALTATAHAGPTGSVRGVVTVERPPNVVPGPVLVYLVGFEEPPASATPRIVQKDRQFSPDLVAITAGQSVAFPNSDSILHNVFSPTPARRFDLGSYRRGESKSRVFPKPGVVDVFCNIHPSMSATIVVLPNRRFVLADGKGGFAIDGIPPGTWTIFAYSRRARTPVSTKVTVRASAATEVALTLEEVVRDFSHKNKYGETYRDPEQYR
jgi:plastocyanin